MQRPQSDDLSGDEEDEDEGDEDEGEGDDKEDKEDDTGKGPGEQHYPPRARKGPLPP